MKIRVSRSILLRMRSVLDKAVEKIETCFTFSNFFFIFKNRAVFGTVWENMVAPEDRPQAAI